MRRPEGFFFEVFDRLRKEIDCRFQALDKFEKEFLFVQFEKLKSNVFVSPKFFGEKHDVPEDVLLCEVERFKRMSLEFSDQLSLSNILCTLSDLFPFLFVASKLYMTQGISVAGCERSFSKLKIIKNYLRNTMGQTRLNALSLLSIESERTRKINIDAVLDSFFSVPRRV